MTSIEDLKKIRDAAKAKMTMRLEDDVKYRVVVGMATCGIASGARQVLNTLVEEVGNRQLPVIVLQTGNIAECHLEPIVEVYNQNNEKTTYCLVDTDKAKEIVQKHLIGGKVIEEYTLEKNNK